MRLDRRGQSFTRITLAVGALVLGGCVSGGYVYDDDPRMYYRGSSGDPPYYSYGYPRYYGYPPYYVPPGDYRYSPYPPRVVYYDHDHRGDECRHPSHRDGRRGGDRDGHDRNDRDRPAQDRDGRPDRRPPGEGPATPSPQWRNPPREVSPGGAAAPRSEPEPRGMRALRVKQPNDTDTKSEARKELD